MGQMHQSAREVCGQIIIIQWSEWATFNGGTVSRFNFHGLGDRIEHASYLGLQSTIHSIPGFTGSSLWYEYTNANRLPCHKKAINHFFGL